MRWLICFVLMAGVVHGATKNTPVTDGSKANDNTSVNTEHILIRANCQSSRHRDCFRALAE